MAGNVAGNMASNVARALRVPSNMAVSMAGNVQVNGRYRNPSNMAVNMAGNVAGKDER